MTDNDPYAAYGGSAITADNSVSTGTGDDPYAGYGGSAEVQKGETPPMPLSGSIGSVPIPAGLQKGSVPGVALGSSAGEIGGTVGSHLKNLVAGPIKAALAPPQGTAENLANAAMPGGLALYRTAIKPSIAPAQQAISDVQQGNIGDAIQHAERAVPIAGPMTDQFVQDARDRGAAAAVTGIATDLLAPKGAGELVKAVAPALKSSAIGIINKNVIGARQADFARGANPGRGYLESGLGPSGSMESIADKAKDARGEVGQALGDAYKKADAGGKLIPATTVRDAIGKIIKDAMDKASGPGVMADPGQYRQLADTFRPALTKAWNKGGFTPSELWDIRKNLNDSLNWGDQSKLNLTRTQQRVSGALGGLLEDAVPEVKDLNRHYQDLSKLHSRAAQRSLTGQHSLTGMAAKAASTGLGALAGGALHSPLGAAGGAIVGAALDSLPAKTTFASGLNAASKAAPLAPLAALPTTLAGVSANPQPQTVGNANEDQSQPAANQEIHQASTPDQQYTPDSHHFNIGQWLQTHTAGNVERARKLAESLGFEVTE